MYELYRNGPFADSRRDPLDRAMTDVAYHENSRDAGFKEIGIALERPIVGAFPVLQEVRTGKYETAVIALNKVAEPVRLRRLCSAR